MIELLPTNVQEEIHSSKSILSITHVIKELIENSIDAGATRIKLSFLNYGLDIIEIEDNGIGITEENLKKCLARGYTTKNIQFNSHGFKGEALASIASLSNVVVLSGGKQLEKNLGREQKIQDSNYTIKGTKIIIQNIFANMKTRRSALEKNKLREFRHLVDHVKFLVLPFTYLTLALVNIKQTPTKEPKFSTKKVQELEVSKTSSFNFEEFLSNLFSSLAQKGDSSPLPEKYSISFLESLKLRFFDLFGIHLSSKLVTAHSDLRLEPISEEPASRYKLFLVCSKANLNSMANNKSHQFFFVNNKAVSLPQLQKQINTFYSDSLNIPTGLRKSFPFLLVVLFMDSGLFDIMFSPSKNEVLFRREEDLFDGILSEIQRLIKGGPGGKRIFDSQNDRVVFGKKISDYVNKKEDSTLPTSKDAILEREYSLGLLHERGHGSQIEETKNSSSNILEQSQPREDFEFHKKDISRFTLIGQFNLSFILLEFEGKLIVLDQHAGDEICNFYKILRRDRGKVTDRVKLLKPLFVSNDYAVVEKVRKYPLVFSNIGIELSVEKVNLAKENLKGGNNEGDDNYFFGDNLAVYLKEISSLYYGYEKLLVEDLVGMLGVSRTSSEQPIWPNTYLERAISESCRSSIMIGDSMTTSQMRELLGRLSVCENPFHCPHGRPTFQLLSTIN